MSTSSPNDQAGRFQKGRSGNPSGRPRKKNDLNSSILKAFNEQVTVNQNGTRKKMKKVEAAATQLANQGAAGDIRATKLVLDIAQRAEDKAGATGPASASLTLSDQEIIQNVMARLTRIVTNGLVLPNNGPSGNEGGDDDNA